MKQEEKFEVAAAAFEAHLKNAGLWREYFMGFRKTHLDGSSSENYTRWKTWAIKQPMHHWVSGALEWDETQSGVDIWIHFDHMWLTWVCFYFNN